MKALLLLLTLAMTNVWAIQNPSVSVTRRVFYVDSVLGSDKNNGQSPQSPWKSLEPVNTTPFQPGDQILFKSGCLWNGQLRPKGSGQANNPIRLGRYENGPLPRIDQGNLSGNVIQLENQDYWEIEQLEVSGGTPKPDQSAGGIHVLATTAGRVLKHIVIRNCIIRNIIGTPKQYESCAIWVGVPGMNQPNGLTTGFDDVLIEKNQIFKADRCGILVWTTSGPGNASQFQPGLIPSKNVIIRHNRLEDIGGDAILVLGSDSPLIERNTVRRSCQKTGDPALGGGYNPSSAAIWLHHCKNGVMQFNAVYDSGKLPGNNDGMAYDFDFNCTGCILQYNFSSNNAGGFLLIMNSATHNIVRYNLSENDRDHVLFLVGKLNEENLIYNNTFYLNKGDAFLIPAARIWNNIFFADGTSTFHIKKSERGEFKSNGYCGKWKSLPPDSGKITSNPMFNNPGKAGLNGENLAAYRLGPASPCRNKGVVVKDPGEHDLLRMKIPKGVPPTIGACQ